MNPTQTFIHITDTHILPSEHDRLHGVDTMQTLLDALALIDEAGLTPDAWLFTGDLANDGEPEAYERLRVVLRDLEERSGKPVLTAMGNHDKREPFRQFLLGQEPSGEPYRYVREVAGARLIVLDSTVPGSHYGEIGEEQRAWLRQELDGDTETPTLLLLHHPPTPGPIELLNSLIVRDREELAAVIEGRSNVAGLLAGHVHHPTFGVFAGVACAATPATAYTVDPLFHESGFRGVSGPGFAVISLFGNAMIATAVQLPAEREELYRYELTQEQWDSLLAKHGASANEAEREMAAASGAH